MNLARSTLPLLLVALGAPSVSAQIPPSPTETVRPWFYTGTGNLVWERHQFAEDTASTVFALPFDFVTLPAQPAARPDVLLLNGPHYDPPEGVAAVNGSRKLLRQSLEGRALQLYVNYGDVPVGSGPAPTYPAPTFFVSHDGPNQQTTPSVLDVQLSAVFIAPTRAALGIVGTQLQPHVRAPVLQGSLPPIGNDLNALYVTAGVGVAMTEFNASSYADALAASQDRLFLRQPNQTWLDRSDLVPASARDGNSSGVCFADFNGDGYMDLFVGLYGDDFAGAQSRLLIYRPAGVGVAEAFLDETSARMPSYANAATVDVAAADLDGDGDQDLVMANRARRSGAIGTESLDYAFLNNGTGTFALRTLAPGVFSDSRSVAVGNLDSDAKPEIVLGNAGASGFSNTLDVPAGSDHPLQIFRDVDPSSALVLQDVLTEFIPSNEAGMSRPWTWQVLIADLFGAAPNDFMPDGALDLLLVNHRDILLDHLAPGLVREASNLRFLVNPKSSTTRVLIPLPRVDKVPWATTVALADFSHNTPASGYGDCAANTLDLFIGTGNSFSGCDSLYLENMGSKAGAWPPWNLTDPMEHHLSYDAMPGNERGYGFDFADFNGNGWMDALQTSRGYDFLVTDMLTDTGAHIDGNRHWNLTLIGSQVDFSNVRGQLFPIGAEDGVFADFDRDGALDVLLASQIKPTFPAFSALETGESVVLRGTSSGVTGFLHDVTTVPAFGGPLGTETLTRDLYIDIKQRNAFDRPTIADRALAVDLDNDGDEDALVHLFPIAGTTGLIDAIKVPQLGTDGLTLPVGRYSAGWRVLRNITTTVPPNNNPPWFRDLADARLHDGAYANGFSSEWNRERGVDLLADFDNNGACDFFTAVGAKQVVGADVTTVHQGHDLLFMNGVSPAPVGHFVERSAALGVPQRVLSASGTVSTAGCSGLAQGDIDNDGDADLFVSCGARDFYSELLINNLTSGGGGSFVDEFQTRVPTAEAQLSPKVHSLGFNPPLTTPVRDDAGAPLLVDLDADGDLDLIYAVASNVPRFFRNKGQDTNQDGFITATDTLPPGTFEDWTNTWVQRIRPLVDSVDAQAVDIDRDGDFDLAFDCFADEVVLLRNDAAHQGARPALTEAWPRVGALRGRKVVLEGVNLSGATALELVSRATGQTVVVPQAAIANETNGRISFLLPTTAPLGLVQLRVQRANPPTPGEAWSRQYFGYFVLGSWGRLGGRRHARKGFGRRHRRRSARARSAGGGATLKICLSLA